MAQGADLSGAPTPFGSGVAAALTRLFVHDWRMRLRKSGIFVGDLLSSCVGTGAGKLSKHLGLIGFDQ